MCVSVSVCVKSNAHTHLARTCGSIISGHRLALLTIMPFSTEKASVGRPWMCHCLILMGSPYVTASRGAALQGTPFSRHLVSQSATHCLRKSVVKAPR
jgi:hypothetical protein